MNAIPLFASLTISMIVYFLVSSSWLVSVSCNFLLPFCFFGTLFHAGGYLQISRTFSSFAHIEGSEKLIGSSVHVLWELLLTVGFPAVSSDWASSFSEKIQWHAYSPFLCVDYIPQRRTSWSPGCWHLEGIGLAPGTSWVEGKVLTIQQINCLSHACFHCETLLWHELCLVLFTLWFTSLKMTLLFGGKAAASL